MSRERWLEFHDSTVLSVELDSMRAVIELDGYFHLWEGSEGRVISENLSDDEGTLAVPISVKRATILELTASSGEKLRISARRFRAQTVGKPRFVEGLPSDMDPEKNAK